MQPISEYTWSHVKSKYFAMYAPVKSYVCGTPTLAAYALNAASSWQNPPLGPPRDPLKYGTPTKVIIRGKIGQWASRLITLKRVLYQRLLQPC